MKLLADDSTSKAVGIRGDEIIAVDLDEALQTEKNTHFDYLEMCDILS